jgi:hypothetical protein
VVNFTILYTFMKKISSLLLVLGISVVSFPSTAFAGGGLDPAATTQVNTNQVQTGNGVASSSPILQTGGNSVTVSTPTVQSSNQTSTASGLSGVQSIAPLTQLQTGNYNYSSTSTQFSGSNYGNNQCGLSIGASKNNSNTSLQDTYSVDVRLSSAQCPNYTQLAEQETKRVKLSVQGSAINTCIVARRDLAAQGKDPNLACNIVDTTQFKSVMD